MNLIIYGLPWLLNFIYLPSPDRIDGHHFQSRCPENKNMRQRYKRPHMIYFRYITYGSLYIVNNLSSSWTIDQLNEYYSPHWSTDFLAVNVQATLKNETINIFKQTRILARICMYEHICVFKNSLDFLMSLK